MFGIGLSEFIVLGIILMILIGPQQLPHVMKVVAKFVRQITQAKNEFTKVVDQDDSLRSIRDSMTQVEKSVKGKVAEVKFKVEREVNKVSETAEKDDRSKPKS